MRKILTILFILIAAATFGQPYTYHLRYDSVKFTTANNSEFVLRSSTRDTTNGLLLNIGGGITQFIRIRAISATQFTVGTDTITITGSGGGGGGSGTVTNVASGFGLSGGPITITGTLFVDTSNITSWLSRIKLADSLGLLIAGKAALSHTHVYADLTSFPAQSGQGGKYLTTDGSVLSWGTVNVDSSIWTTFLWDKKGKDSLGALIATKQGTLTLTTTGASGAATLIGNTLNIPQYSGGVAWGAITGTIGDQTDLASALALNAPLASPTFTGTVTIPTPFTLGAVSVLPTGTELNYVDGVTSAIQTQLDAKVAISAINNYTVNPFNKALTALGSTIKYTAWGRTQLEVTGTGNLSDGIIKGILIDITEATTITGLQWWQTVAGDYTAADFNGVALYSLNTSTGVSTLVANSTTDGNIWKGAANAMYSKAFSSPYAAAAGQYYGVVLYNQSAQTTAPGIGVMVASQGTGLHSAGLTNSTRTNFQIVAQASPPATIAGSAQVANGVPFWVGTY